MNELLLLRKGRIYQLLCRNLKLGVYDGNGGFIGIRTKFGARFLDRELHWKEDEHYGTVRNAIDTSVDVPVHIEIATSLGSVDGETNRPVAFDRPIADGGRGWYFKDTGETSPAIRPYSVANKPLFNFLLSQEEVLLHHEKA
jgi:hypothetical protein